MASSPQPDSEKKSVNAGWQLVTLERCSNAAWWAAAVAPPHGECRTTDDVEPVSDTASEAAEVRLSTGSASPSSTGRSAWTTLARRILRQDRAPYRRRRCQTATAAYPCIRVEGRLRAANTTGLRDPATGARHRSCTAVTTGPPDSYSIRQSRINMIHTCKIFKRRCSRETWVELKRNFGKSYDTL